MSTWPRSSALMAWALASACASAPAHDVAPPVSPTVRHLAVEFCAPFGEAHRNEVGASLPAMVAPDQLDGDRLLVTADYTGGCSPHQFKICATEFVEADPPQIPLKVIHHTDDRCANAVREKMSIDLAPLKRTYERMYRRAAGAVLIELPNGELLYRFAR